jgi:hypothetical protein
VGLSACGRPPVDDPLPPPKPKTSVNAATTVPAVRPVELLRRS